jgi:hypothetical protein
MSALTTLALVLLAQTGGTSTKEEATVWSDEEVSKNETPKDMALEFKLGPYMPLVDREPTLTGKPYETTFGTGPMLLGELEFDYQFFTRFGSIGAGFSIGYAEKYGHAIDPTTGETSSEATSLQIVPMQLLAVYRFDVLAEKVHVPLVPYLKGGLVMIPWWSSKGGEIETSNGFYGAGVRWGLAFIPGLALQLDFLEPRLARDLDSSTGINHSYLFAEFHLAEVNDFGQKVLDLSSRHFMFGLAIEF